MKTCITILAIFICLVLQAQIEKGTMSVGSTLEGTYDKSLNNYKSYNISLYNWQVKVEPSFEYFVKKNFSIGVGTGYNIKQNVSNTEPLDQILYPSINKNSYESFSLTLFARKFWSVNKKLAFYIQPKLSSFYNINNIYFKTENPNIYDNIRNENSNYWNHNITLSAGVHYFVRPKWALKAETLVSHFNIKNNDQSITLIYPNINLVFGVNYFFGVNKSKQ